MGTSKFSGKTVLVTGASSGIGRQAAIMLSRQGGTVVVSGRDPQKLDETFGLLDGKGHLALTADLTEESQVTELVASLPQLNGVVYCAGIIGPTPAKFIRPEDIRKMMGINFKAPVLITAAILRKNLLENNSSIVFMSTIATQHPYFGGSLYNSSKAALESYAKTLALELIGKGIRSNCLSPGLVNTPMITDPAREGNPEFVDESLAKYLNKYPMGVGEPDDVANAILFFLSDDSKWISGQNLSMGAIVR